VIKGLKSLALCLGFSLTATSVAAQSLDNKAVQNTSVKSTLLTQSEKNPDYCINTMASFPTENHEIRYQFFRLTEEAGRDMTPNLRQALRKYGDQKIAEDSSMLQAIEDIANPVLRQAAPEITIANMAHVVDFATICEPIITGQINSLTAYDNALTDVAFNAVIVEDALFLRQILSDSLFRLGANEDPITLYMDDLDGRLKRSNDIINEEMDREVLGDSVALSDSMNEAAKKKAKERQLYTLIRILGGGG